MNTSNTRRAETVLRHCERRNRQPGNGQAAIVRAAITRLQGTDTRKAAELAQRLAMLNHTTQGTVQ